MKKEPSFDAREARSDAMPRRAGAGAAFPSVSVVVPTRNRAELLADTLVSLMEQDYPPDRMEIVVVDNASTDNTAAVVGECQARSPFPIAYYLESKRGPAAARNKGVARSKGEILAFTDSDCRASRSWVRMGVQEIGPGVGLVSGPILPVVNPNRAPTFFSHQIDHSSEGFTYPTANVFYRREVFARVGGFDEGYGSHSWGPPVMGEDAELAWRAKRAGFESVFTEDAIVYHEATEIGPARWLADPLRASAYPYMVSRIPELRDCFLWQRWFLDRNSAAFYLAMAGAGVIAMGKRPLGLALALPWIWLMRGWVVGDVWPPSRWWRIPVKYALLIQRFLVLVATLIATSVRYRTPVL